MGRFSCPPRAVHSRLDIDRASEFPGPAATTHRLVGIVKIVVNGQFFTLANRAQAHVKDVASDDSRHQIRLAGVVDEFSAGAAYSPVDGPVVVKNKKVQS